MVDYKELKKKYERLLKKLPPERFDFDAIFERICASERRRHRSVRIIHEMTGAEPDAGPELLKFVGFPDAVPLGWEHDSPLRYSKGEKSGNGGFIIVAKCPEAAELATFVFLDCNEEVAEDLKGCLFTAILMHEMGHVDDVEKGKNLRVGGQVDLVAAEEYAHRYELRRMRRENLRLPMAMLLSFVLKEARRGVEGTVQREAAARVVESGEYKEFRQFVGNLTNVEEIAGEI
jgi:hypothetical protein